MARKSSKQEEEITFPYTHNQGSVTLKIYKGTSHGCDYYTVAYWQDGVRKRPAFTTFEKALDEAKLIATRLGSTSADVLQLSSADRAAYLRARQILDAIGVPLEAAAAQFADAILKLDGTPLSHAVEYYIKRHPTKIPAKPVVQIVDEMLAAKKNDGLSVGYLRHLRYDLDKFTKRFAKNIGEISGMEIDDWLRGLEVSNRTRNNLRNSIQTLYSFSKVRRYIAKDHDELDSVPLAKDRDGEIDVFTPAELVEILECADAQLIPFLALGAFAGIRHAEIQRLDWRDIRFDDDIIEIRASKAKTASRRTIPITPNLKLWLTANRQTTGLVCAYRNMGSEIYRLVKEINQKRSKAKGAALKKEEQFKWKHNALRHSFISYRIADIQNVAQVALEAGNSPQMIFRHYRELVRPADAKTWFAISPKVDAKVVALNEKVKGPAAEETKDLALAS